MLRIRLTLALSIFLTFAGLSGAPALARAADQHGVATIDATAVALGATKTIPVRTSVCCTGAGQPVAYTGQLTVTVDAAGAAGVLTTTVSGPGCTTAGTVTTCRVPMTAATIVDTGIMLTAAAAPDAAVGGRASYAFTVQGPELAAWSGVSGPIEVTGHGPDLRTQDTSATGTVQPGGHTSFRPVLTNVGDRPTTWVGFYLDNAYDTTVDGPQRFADFDSHYGNCYYWTQYDDYDSAECYLPLVIQPGESVRATAPIGLTLRGSAPHKAVAGVRYYVGAETALGESWGREFGDGPDLAFEPLPGSRAALDPPDADIYDGDARFRFRTGPNKADAGATVSASEESLDNPALSTVTVAATNHGPAHVFAKAGRAGATMFLALTVTFPAGTTVVTIKNFNPEYDAWCAPVVNGRPLWPASIREQGKPQGLVYRCVGRQDLTVGGSFRADFDVRPPAGTRGRVIVAASGLPNDPTRANDIATTLIGKKATNPGPSAGSGPGSAPGDGSGPNAGGGSDPDTGSGGEGGGSLPITGAPAAGIAVAGVSVLIAGLMLMLGTRRRRQT
ncbi:hypothetical protein [Actinoplanes sp. NPDC051494]|uniref:hypothetical protein n=1 Tax=Actinoplanes sp. NPDC051494 TaxID=3363907 RepID=UPI00379A21E6